MTYLPRLRFGLMSGSTARRIRQFDRSPLSIVYCPLIAVATLTLALSGCSPATPADGRRIVYAGIAPVAYLARRIGGPFVQVEVLVKPGQDAHIYEPTPRQVVMLGKAGLFLEVGLPFEAYLASRFASEHPMLRVVDTTAGIVKRPAEVDADEPATAEKEQYDPHVWLSPVNLKLMAANVCAALSADDPQHATDFERNRQTLSADIDRLDTHIKALLSPFRGQTFYVFHPAFGYFADRYGLKQEAVEIEGKSPPPRQLSRLIRQARANEVKIIFLQPQFDKHCAQTVAQAIGGAVVPLDDLADDVLGNLSDVADKIASAEKPPRENK